MVTEEDACIRFLSSLPPSYAGFVTSQNTMITLAKQVAAATGTPMGAMSVMTVNSLIAAVIQEEATRSQHKSAGKNHALFTSKPNSNKFQKKPQRGGTYHKGQPSGSGQASNSKRTGNCRWCGIPNHWERDCRKKKAGEPRVTPPVEANTVQKKDRPSPSVLCAQIIGTQTIPPGFGSFGSHL